MRTRGIRNDRHMHLAQQRVRAAPNELKSEIHAHLIEQVVVAHAEAVLRAEAAGGPQQPSRLPARLRYKNRGNQKSAMPVFPLATCHRGNEGVLGAREDAAAFAAVIE